MPFISRLRRERPRPGAADVGVVIITGSCCNPHMLPFDAEARRVIAQAIAESGIRAEVKELPATGAFFGGAPTVMRKVIAMLNEEGRIGLPAVLVNGEVVS